MIETSHAAVLRTGNRADLPPVAEIGAMLLPAILLAIALSLAGSKAASAQSYDPDVGSGNIAHVDGGGAAGYDGGYSGYAESEPGWTGRVHPYERPRHRR